MARVSKGRYNLQVLAIMAVYVVLMLFEWPLVGKTEGLALRTLLALLPTLPVVVVIVLAARMVMRGDELEQRMHLIALSVAVGVISVASIVGGFLAVAKVWTVGGDVLFWVFPLLCMVYGITRVVLVRRVTGAWDFWGC
ncbi:MAG TPA: hypothetical protein VHA71_12950 [Rhodanobacteraceae bacterium]|jgi:hypothetical protein|nr:hypothetical protein [Rhodanobacteraceae bacterium]